MIQFSMQIISPLYQQTNASIKLLLDPLYPDGMLSICKIYKNHVHPPTKITSLQVKLCFSGWVNYVHATQASGTDQIHLFNQS